jgi:hypothetical protein
MRKARSKGGGKTHRSVKSMPRPKLNAQSSSTLHLAEDLRSSAAPFPFIAYPRRRSESRPRMGGEGQSSSSSSQSSAPDGRDKDSSFVCVELGQLSNKIRGRGGGGDRRKRRRRSPSAVSLPTFVVGRKLAA